jgi:SAM-dependent methyltransferase
MLNRGGQEPEDIGGTMPDNWDDIASWWITEAAADPTYPFDVNPVLADLLPGPVGTLLDLGCGEGQTMPLVQGRVIGIDLSFALAAAAARNGDVVVSMLPDLGTFKEASVDGAYSIYLLDLIRDHEAFFDETARVVRPGGTLVIIINHPVFTAPGSVPLMDADGEVLWRWGTYFERGSSLEPAGHRDIRYYHRPLGDLLTAAAAAGWRLDRLIERGLSPEAIAVLPGYEGQERIPRLLGVRWQRDDRP